MFIRPILFIPANTKIDFVAKRWCAFSVTIILVLITIGALYMKGLNFGIDFKGGILIEAQAQETVDLSSLRTQLDGLGLGEIALQQFGTPKDVLIRIQRQEGDEAAQMKAIQQVRDTLGTNYEYRRVEVVDARQWGKNFCHAGILATILAIAAISLYCGRAV